MLVYIQGWSLSEAPARAEPRAGPAGGSQRREESCSQQAGLGAGEGAPGDVLSCVTFAVKNPCLGEQGKGTERKPGRADVRMLQRSLFLTEETGLQGETLIGVCRALC